MFRPLLRRDRSKGFSLIEILLVLAIIGIISGISVPFFVGQRRRATIIGDGMSNARVIQMALEARRADMGSYGTAGEYPYPADGTRPSVDIIPGFTAKGNSKLDYKITIGATGLTYNLDVTDPQDGRKMVVADQTGKAEKYKK